MREEKILQTKLFLYAAVWLPAFVFCFAVRAENISLKTYSSADGLVHDSVNKIVADSLGFLWFCTEDGLSRFDGSRFKNYTQEHGLPHRNINDFLETKDGDYLVATSGGVAVFNPNGKIYRWNVIEEKLEQTSGEPPLFKTFVPSADSQTLPSKAIMRLAQDKRGNIYATHLSGIYRFVKNGGDWQFEKIEYSEWNAVKTGFGDLLEDDWGGVWVAASVGIYRMLPDGAIEKISDTGADSLFKTQNGQIWADSGGYEIGIRVFDFPNGGGKAVLQKTYTKADGLPGNKFSNAVAQTPDGQIFVISEEQLFRFNENAPHGQTKFQPLGVKSVISAAQYQNRSIWLSLFGKGVGKFTTNDFVNFTEKDGVPERISSLFADLDGNLIFTSRHESFRLNNGKIERLKPFGNIKRSWGDTFLDFQARNGDWLIPTTEGLARYANFKNFSDLARKNPMKIYTTADGLDSNEIFSAFEDSRGDIWFGTLKGNFLYRLEKATEKIIGHQDENAIPKDSLAIAYGEDFQGNIWAGFFHGDLVRYKDGVFRSLTKENLFPRSRIEKILSDSKNRLWIATSSRGVFRVDNPDAETPVFTHISTADGLPSNQTFSTVEDNFGRIFIGTGRGIVRLDTETGKMKIYTTADGLANNLAVYSLKDKAGNLWFSSFNSITKFTPQADKNPAPPPIFIDGISAGGKVRNISELGATEIKNLEFASDERQIQVGFFAISFESGESLRYQYKLNTEDWSAPTDQRNVSFDLAAGNYDFAVRAVNSDGVFSEKPAVISFKIQPPIYQRWWFLVLSSLFVLAVLYVIYRRRTDNLRRINAALTEAKIAEENLRKSREERLAELQKVRTRIATDLHDDIGSSLTQIAVLTEVARGHASFLEAENLSMPLERIKNVSKELVAVMSDVVWAINPQKDFLHDLVQRMRRFASDVFTTRGIKFEFSAPEIEGNLSLGANIRREVFAIFKESVNNAVKYSECKTARAEFRIEGNNLMLKISDNGKGFDTKTVLSDDFKPEMGGNGLVNMRRRARDLGGECKIVSEIGKGTTINLSVPLQFNQNGSEK